MNQEVTFFIENSTYLQSQIKGKKLPSNNLYGGHEFKMNGWGNILEPSLKNIISLLKHTKIAIIHKPKFVLPLKILGKKVVLININSNNYLKKIKKSRYFFNLINFKLCDKIVCLSETQLPNLHNLRITKTCVIPLGVDFDLISKYKLDKKYFISSGIDKGKNYDYLKRHINTKNLVILNEKNFLPYKEYLEKMSKSKALVLKIDMTEKASDLSGSTVCFEALLMKKPIIINNLPWLKELLKENYYVYNNEEELKKLVKKKIKFKQTDYSNLKLDNYLLMLKKEVDKLK